MKCDNCGQDGTYITYSSPRYGDMELCKQCYIKLVEKDGEPQEKPTEKEREQRKDREHDTYKQDHWTVVDINHVDRVFATKTKDRTSKTPQVRVDLDGFISNNTISDVGEDGDNVQTSIWLSIPEAKELIEQMEEAVEAHDRDSEESEGETEG